MKERKKLIKNLNGYFPGCDALEGAEFGEEYKNSIWFTGEDVISETTNDLNHPINKYLMDNGWYIELYDDVTALAYPVKG